MVDKDDLFKEEDGTDPQDHGGDEPSSDEDDDIIDLFDTVDIPADAIEEDIIELEDITQETDSDVHAITQEIEIPETEDEILDLTEPVIEDEPEDEAIDFLDTIEMPGKDIEEDVIEPADIAQETEPDDHAITQEIETPETEDEILDLTEPVIEDEPEDEAIDHLDTVEMSMDDIVATNLDDNNLDAVDMVESPAAEEEAQGEILDPTETVAEDSTGQAVMDQMEPVESTEPVQDELVAETATPPSVGYEEDKELLELIDDIQATLNDEPIASHVDDREDISEEDEAADTDTREEDAESYTFLDDDGFMDDKGIPQSETDFVDHLGIDLTSEIERKALEESQEATMEDVQPTEGMEPAIGPGSLETAVKQALTEMLTDENNPLTKAIENAVKKALGQGENT